MQQPENYIGTWYENEEVTDYGDKLWERARELKTVEAKNKAYDFMAKQFGKKCDDCGHFFETVWRNVCWVCCEKKKGTVFEESDLEWVEKKYGCVCCREMKWDS